MISAVPSVSSVHVELDGRLSSTGGRTDETSKKRDTAKFGTLEDSLHHLLPWDIELIINDPVDEPEEEPEV